MPNVELSPQIIACSKMKDVACPHCHNGFHGAEKTVALGRDADGEWAVSGILCTRPECRRLSLNLHKGERFYATPALSPVVGFKSTVSRLIRPETLLPKSIPPGVDEKIEQDYIEATKVLSISLNASAALSRRCLQNILRQISSQETENFPDNGSLFDEIEAVRNSKKIPPLTSDKLHAVRELGNLGAHPLQDKHTNAIVDVKPEEAELTLEIIDELLDHYYVQEPKTKKTIERIHTKYDATKKH